MRTPTIGTRTDVTPSAVRLRKFRDGGAQVSFDVDRERLQRRNVENAASLVGGGLRLVHEPSQAAKNAAASCPKPVGASSNVDVRRRSVQTEVLRAVGGPTRRFEPLLLAGEKRESAEWGMVPTNMIGSANWKGLLGSVRPADRLPPGFREERQGR